MDIHTKTVCLMLYSGLVLGYTTHYGSKSLRVVWRSALVLELFLGSGFSLSLFSAAGRVRLLSLDVLYILLFSGAPSSLLG